MIRRNHAPLSRQALNRLAAKQILGREFLAEVKRIEKGGMQFDLHFEGGISVSAVISLLLRNEVTNDVTNPNYLALGVASRLDQALKQARSDPDFLKLRLDDFRTQPGSKDASKIYVSDWHKIVLRAAAHQLGYDARYDRVSWNDHESPGADAWGHIPDSFIAELAAGKVSWLDLLRHADPNVRQHAAGYLADPADPEAVAIRLIRHRLNHLESELELTLEHEREQMALLLIFGATNPIYRRLGRFLRDRHRSKTCPV